MKRDTVIGNVQGETTEGRNDTDYGSRTSGIDELSDIIVM